MNIIDLLRNTFIRIKVFESIYEINHRVSRHNKGQITFAKGSYLIKEANEPNTQLVMVSKFGMTWDYVKHYLVPEKLTRKCKLDSIAQYCTLGNAQLETVKMLIEWCGDDKMLSKTINVLMVCKAGHIDIVEFLMTKYSLGVLHLAKSIDYAASSGRLEMVQWLHNRFGSDSTSNSSGICTTDAIDWAAKGGHIQVVKWLKSKRKEGMTEDAIISACEGSCPLEFIQWMAHSHIHVTRVGIECAMVGAASGGRLDVVIWLFGEYDHRISDDAMTSAIRSGHVDVLEWMYERVDHDNIGLYDAIDIAAKSGHLNMVKWIHSNVFEDDIYSSLALEYAAANGDVEMCSWIHSNIFVECTNKSIRLAAENGHLGAVEWLIETRGEFNLYRDTLRDSLRQGGLNQLLDTLKDIGIYEE
ncbi:hypothetical protein DFA_03991 [Cavenderia fasciculata]|uniref:Ankyrin repeat-containing protein n=1 Tax=Cavenderia fasciculata TaxID=261658 RepID=F4Q0Z6_CACFS|nr:uncharacterized protein DFA_03991 [Cavenderia fasciculata]EGG18497.1 hypothetical protein DFA_03991 [Cavenderia fasciculata]|eukprot:XP_004366401.1 hypothetical protein DFA_03991 [Cavenderia fasciculata]